MVFRGRPVGAEMGLFREFLLIVAPDFVEYEDTFTSQGLFEYTM